MDIEETTTGSIAGAIRYHPIDWNARSIPIGREDIDWLGEYQSEDYELVQFHVSKALGRVVGFFDEDKIFNIVLLDPLHNLQPSKKNEYRIRDTRVAECDLTRMSLSFERAIFSCNGISDDHRSIMLQSMSVTNTEYFGSAVHLTISDRHLIAAYGMVHGGLVGNIGELLEFAIDTWQDENC